MLAAVLYLFITGNQAVATRLLHASIPIKQVRALGLVFVAIIIATGSAKAVVSLSRPSKLLVRVVVQPGDTVWNYAEKYGDPNRYILSRVQEIMQINHMTGEKALTPGQIVVIPTKK